MDDAPLPDLPARAPKRADPAAAAARTADASVSVSALASVRAAFVAADDGTMGHEEPGDGKNP